MSDHHPCAGLVMPAVTATILPFAEVGPSRAPNQQRRSLVRRAPSLSPSIEGLVEEARRRLALREAAEELLSGKYSFGPRSTLRKLDVGESAEYGHEQRFCQELQKSVESVGFVAEHMKCEMAEKKVNNIRTGPNPVLQVRDDWKYVAMVIDRFLLYVFFGITLGGTLGILLSAPYIFHSVDQQRELSRLTNLYKAGRQN